MENKVINNLPPQDGREYVLTVNGWELSEEEQRKEKWYKVPQAAKEAGVKESVIRAAIRQGYIIACEVPSATSHGYTKYIKESDLLDWVSDPKKIRDKKAHDDYLAYMRMGYEKRNSDKPKKTKKTPKPEPTLVVDTVDKPGYNDDILKLAEYFEKIITKHEIAAYDTGFADGKLSVQHDDEEAYRRGVEEGKKQAKSELLAIIKEV